VSNVVDQLRVIQALPLLSEQTESGAFQSVQSDSAAPGSPSRLRQLLFIDGTNCLMMWIIGNLLQFALWHRIGRTIQISCGLLI
jgi:hypothetical protein